MFEKKKVHVAFAKSAETLELQSDRGAVHNILQSLISNALSYTHEGGAVTVSIEQQEDTVQIAVVDTGIGIPEDERETIFQKFSRAANAQNARPHGSGLGLYIAQEAVELLGGAIHLESEEGKGTTFFVTLPLVSKARKGTSRFVQE